MSSSGDIQCPIEVKLVGESSKTIPKKMSPYRFWSAIVGIDKGFCGALISTRIIDKRETTQNFYWGEIADYNSKFMTYPHSFDGKYIFSNNDGFAHTQPGSFKNFKGFRLTDIQSKQIFVMCADNHVEDMYIDPFGKYILVKLMDDEKVFEYSITPSLSYKVCVQMSLNKRDRNGCAICLYSDGRLCFGYVGDNMTSFIYKLVFQLTPETKCTVSTDDKLLLDGCLVSFGDMLDIFCDSRSIKKWKTAINACIFNLALPLKEQAKTPDEIINNYLKPPMHFAQVAMMKSHIRIPDVAVRMICNYMMRYI